MAKKKSKAAPDSVQAKAKAMREAQARADKRTRNVVIGVVTVVVLAILATMIFVVKTQSQSKSTGMSGASDATVPEQYADGEPIAISHLGVGQKDENLADLKMYFSYSCSWCALLESSVGNELASAARNGDYNLLLQPVNTSYMPFQGPATFAALQVAAHAPDQFSDFQQGLAEFFLQASYDSDNSITGDAQASQEKVYEIAAAAGVPSDVLELLGGDASEYLVISTEAWTSSEVDGRDGGLGTPELVYDGSKVSWSQGTPEEIMASIEESMAALGYVPGGK